MQRGADEAEGGSGSPTRSARGQIGGELARLRDFFDKAPGFMAATIGPDHVFEMANAAYLKLVGNRELIGRSVAEAFPDLAGTGFVELLDAVYASGEPQTGTAAPLKLVRRPGGEPEQRYLDYVFQPVFDREGRVSGLVVEGHDVTERQEVELKLRESEERFRLIADSAPVPIWVTKLDRTRSFVNRAYADFVGLPYDEALLFDWRAIIHPDDQERVLAASAEGERRLEPFLLEARYRRHDGSWRWLRSESQPRLGTQGEHIGFIGVAHDITESKAAEAALREVNETLERRVAERTAELSAALERLKAETAERQRVEEALRQAQKMDAVGQLTGGIAHDFNNLLTPIVGGLEVISRKVGDSRTQRMAETALQAARRAAKLTGQLLTFSRIQRIQISPVQVNGVIRGMEDLLRRTLGRDLRVVINLAPDAGHARCDANQLENAVLNLAINARDAMAGGGTLTISSRRSRHDGEPDLADGDYVVLTVFDTGCGMPPEVVARATEPFFSTKPIGKGTGLGLAQVYGIARQSEGTVRIRSEVGRGTCVDLILPVGTPLASAVNADSDCEMPVAANGGGSLVMVVDDDADVRAFLAVALEGLGHRVVEALDGPSGLARAADLKPDLILLDYAMPDMNGADVARALRRADPAIPILFVTGYADTAQIEAAVGGRVPLLRKPFSVAQLAAAISSVMPLDATEPAIISRSPKD